MSDWSNLKWTDADEQLVKLWFSPEHLSGLFEPGRNTHEISWGRPLGSKLHEMREPMFWVHGVSLFDKVETFLDEEGWRQVSKILEKSGYRTIRVTTFGSSIAEEISRAVEKWARGGEAALLQTATIFSFPIRPEVPWSDVEALMAGFAEKYGRNFEFEVLDRGLEVIPSTS